ncbi:MAG: DUF2336 domain-containing protein [Alphaproteobacteria bacterium]|nr:DUF2336 domain-containing protein [Alphaproteobacteria bacterium]
MGNVLPLRPSYDEAKAIARAGDAAQRAALAARPDTPPEMLYYLASDQSPGVRAAVAANTATPRQADMLLLADAADPVRVTLARKVATLAPTISDAGRDRLGRLTAEVLTRLVEDATIAVRAAIAETVKGMPDAPHDLILRIARDVAPSVSVPVLSNSPLLTDEDLLGLIAEGLSPAALCAIARRDNLGEDVGDAIAATEEIEAVGALLRNPSARIRETTLDFLVARAAEITEFQEPLVHRPALPPRIALALASVVTDRLAQVLATRGDLKPDIVKRIRHAVQERVKLQTATEIASDPLARARQLQEMGELDEAVILATASEGDAPFLTALLSTKAAVDHAHVARAVELRSAKGIVALCWKAGLSMATAVRVQAVLGRLPPEAIIGPTETGNFPLSTAEMRAQLMVLARPAPLRARAWGRG